nr:hypothetical protein [Tanacetum cinerariifolium]
MRSDTPFHGWKGGFAAVLAVLKPEHLKADKARIDTAQKSVVSLSDASSNKALQVAKDSSCSQTPLNREHERVAPIYVLPGPKPCIETWIHSVDPELLNPIVQCLDDLLQGSITEFVYLVEAHHHLNLVFILKDNSPRRLDDGVVMLVLEARGRPLRFGEAHLSLVALNPKLEVLSYNQLSGPLVDDHSENLLVFR